MPPAGSIVTPNGAKTPVKVLDISPSLSIVRFPEAVLKAVSILDLVRPPK